MNDKPITVLLIEDNPGDVRLIKEMLTGIKEGQFNLVCAERLSTGLEHLNNQKIDVVLLDLLLSDSQGLDTLRRVQTTGIPIVVLTGLTDEETAIKAVREGAQDYLLKGHVDTDLLRRALRYAIERKKAEDEIRKSEDKYRALAETTSDGIFTTDKVGNLTYINPTLEKMFGLSFSEAIATHFSKYITKKSALKAMELFAEAVKGKITTVKNIEFMAVHKDKHKFPIEVSAASIIRDGRFDGMECIVRDITERKKVEQEIKQNFEKMRKILEETVDSLASAVGQRDPYTDGHQQRVTKLALAIAAEMVLSQEQMDGIRIAGLLHDVGKIVVPAEILSKPSKLTTAEFSIVKTHCQVGYDILKGIEFPWPIAQIVLQHHERIDGSGYPQGLKGEAIVLGARILAVADVVEAISSHRPYREALGIDKALEEISKNKGILYDADVVEACLKIFNKKKFVFE